MKRFAWSSFAALLSSFLASGCATETTEGSSSSHFVECSQDADCLGIGEAAGCNGKRCVDAEGEELEVGSSGSVGVIDSAPDDVECDPTAPLEKPLEFGDVLLVAEAEDGTLYVVDELDGEQRAFASEDDELVAHDVIGAGGSSDEFSVTVRGPDGIYSLGFGPLDDPDQAFWSEGESDERPRGDAAFNGTELSVLGESALDGFEVRPAVSAIWVEYHAVSDAGPEVVVVRPDRYFEYESMRVFVSLEPGEPLVERRVNEVLRQKDGGSTSIEFQMDGEPARAFFPIEFDGAVFEPGREQQLTVGDREYALASAAQTLESLAELEFLCLPSPPAGWRSTRQMPWFEPSPRGAEPDVTDEQFAAALRAEEEPAQRPEGAFRVIEVPAASNQADVIESPAGWLATSARPVGDSRAPSGYESVLYRSTDGVQWESLPMDLAGDDLQPTGLAYGGGRYVMTARRSAGVGVIWTSEDALDWSETEQPVDVTDLWGDVVYTGGLFFALGVRYLGVSEDGRDWTAVRISTIQARAVAYGNGRYLLVGGGPMQVSEDGYDWQEQSLDCDLPGACDMDPDGNVFQGYQTHLLFAEGRFFSDQLTTEDGIEWEPLAGRIPAAYVGGRFLSGLDLNEGIGFWTTDGDDGWLRVIRPTAASVTESGRQRTSIGELSRDEPLPDTVDVSFEDGLDCTTGHCFLMDGRLILVPPEGSEPLPDRVPRNAEGQPLLSDECPLSSMLFCDDYTERMGCRCDSEAPRRPSDCEDVSHFQCEGALESVDGEWAVEELGPGGCDCDAIDPNQPTTFGEDCEQDASICEAPLSCLVLEQQSSIGPPPPQRNMCTQSCENDDDCPTWEATGYCAGPVRLRCGSEGSCEPRECDL